MKSVIEIQGLINELIYCCESKYSFERIMEKVGDVPDKNSVKLSSSINWHIARVIEIKNEILEEYEEAMKSFSREAG